MTRSYTRPTGENYTPVGHVCPNGHVELEEGKGRDHVMRVVIPEASEEELTQWSTLQTATEDLQTHRQEMLDSEEYQKEYQQWLSDMKEMPNYGQAPLVASPNAVAALRNIAAACQSALNLLRIGDSAPALGLLELLASSWKAD
jgi:hypothetical protein